ncbi:hypothetical protein [Caulobacter sp. RL271]|uniref:Uncharacterized protein n=1 Tax=Caulobacter segnis TaxID=88688 RepID=A0ABY4ZUM5_9CAUL|nr:hypothetical protein [Caulobacter segnis]USQ96517.1 hypothetical protein MZV50_02680 [Caulobacter segnis]
MDRHTSPLLTARKVFAAWVPTITGQLSFSMIGLGTGARCVTANYECPDPASPRVPVRNVAIAMRRQTKDLPFNFWPIPWFKPSTGAEFILVAQSAPAMRPKPEAPLNDGHFATHRDDIGVLRGRVIVIPYHADERAACEQLVDNVRLAIGRAADASPRGGLCTTEFVGDKIDTLLLEAGKKQIASISWPFELFRTGELRVGITDATGAVSEHTGSIDEDRFDELLLNQVYYFIKDVSHRHYHHRDSSDNLLPIVEVKDGDDEAWRRETLWALTRSVLELRRRKRLAGHKNAVGILAYAEAFQGTLARVRRFDEKFAPSELGQSYNFDHTRASLEATIDERAYTTSFWAQLQAFYIATAVAAAALWIAAVQIKDSACVKIGPSCVAPRVPSWVAWSIRTAIERPVWLLAAVFIVAMLHLEFSRRSLKNIDAVRSFSEFVNGWADAIGATVSRWARKRHPIWGDQLGALVATGMTLLFVLFIGYILGLLFGLWNWPLS